MDVVLARCLMLHVEPQIRPGIGTTSSAARLEWWCAFPSLRAGAKLQLDGHVGVQGSYEREPFGSKGDGGPRSAAGERNGGDLREGDSEIGEKMEGTVAYLDQLSSWEVHVQRRTVYRVLELEQLTAKSFRMTLVVRYDDVMPCATLRDLSWFIGGSEAGSEVGGRCRGRSRGGRVEVDIVNHNFVRVHNGRRTLLVPSSALERFGLYEHLKTRPESAGPGAAARGDAPSAARGLAPLDVGMEEQSTLRKSKGED